MTTTRNKNNDKQSCEVCNEAIFENNETTK